MVIFKAAKNSSKIKGGTTVVINDRVEYCDALRKYSQLFSDFADFPVFLKFYGTNLDKIIDSGKELPFYFLEKFSSYSISNNIRVGLATAGSPFYFYVRGYSWEYNRNNNTNCYPQHTIFYWENIGFLLDAAIINAKKCYYENLTDISGPVSRFSIEFWVHRGYTEEVSREIVSKIQKENSNKFYANATILERKERSTACLEYYEKRGFENPIEERKKRQTTFSMQLCIEKYGEDLGCQIFKERQKKWRMTIDSKTGEEKREFQSRQDSSSMEWARKKTKNEEEAKFLYITNLNKKLIGFNRSSKESLIILDKIIEYVKTLSTEIKFFYGAGESNEYWLHDENNLYFYDFTIPTFNLIVEYNGIAWHPKDSQTEWKSPFGCTYEMAIAKDKNKLRLANSKGFEVFEFWSDFTKSENEEKLNSVKKYIYETYNRTTVGNQ